MTMFLMFGGAVLLMILGMATANSLGFTSLMAFWGTGQAGNLFTIAQRMYYAVSGTTLLAIPFFLLMGQLMNKSGISTKLFNIGRAFIGHYSGGLAHAAILASMIMAAMSGSTVACAAGIGLIAIDEMDKSGYDRAFSCGTIASAATLGPIIPPSIIMIVYSSLTGVSVASMFAAGIIPGIILGLAFMLVATVVSKHRKFQKSPKMPWKIRIHSLKDAFFALLAPIIIIGGMFGGFFTATEASAVACLYVAIIGLFVYRTLTWREFFRSFWGAVESTARIMFIIAISGVFQYLLMYLKIPQAVLTLVMSTISSRFLILMFMIFVWLVMGCFLEGTAIMLITVPIFYPILQAIHFDLVQYGIIAVIASAIGVLTPPLGVNLYTVSGISDVPIMSIAREAIPYIFIMIAVCVLLVLVPELSLLLPGLLS